MLCIVYLLYYVNKHQEKNIYIKNIGDLCKTYPIIVSRII